eukprot:2323729-Alexandrium_andersonii.AAC.1
MLLFLSHANWLVCKATGAVVARWFSVAACNGNVLWYSTMPDNGANLTKSSANFSSASGLRALWSKYWRGPPCVSHVFLNALVALCVALFISPAGIADDRSSDAA